MEIHYWQGANDVIVRGVTRHVSMEGRGVWGSWRESIGDRGVWSSWRESDCSLQSSEQAK